MKSFSKLLSLFLALIMLLGVLFVAPVSASAVESKKQSAVVGDGDEEETTGPDDVEETTEPATLPSGDMALPKSLSVDPISIYDGVDTQLVNSYDDEGEHKWTSYVFNDRIKYRVTLQDDTVLESDEDGCVVYNGVEFDIEYDDGQALDSQWGLGAHTVTYSILGLEAEADVTVLASPIDKIEFEDITVVEGTHGNISSYYKLNTETEQEEFVRTYFQYDDDPVYTVYMKDGSTIKSDEGTVTLFGIDRSAEVNTQQFNEPWGVGTRKVTAVLLGREYEFNFTITESDIKSISVTNVTAYDGVDSSITFYYSNGVEYSYKSFEYNPAITITLKNGTVINKHLNDEEDEITVGSNTYNIDSVDDQDTDNEWLEGAHDAYVYVGAVSQKITVNVVENPITDLTVSDVEIYQGLDCDTETDDETGEEWSEYYFAPGFSVTLKNGQTLNGANGSVVIDGKTYKLNFEDDQSYEHQWTAGNTYTVIGSVGSVRCNFNVTIKNDTIKELKLLNDEINVRHGVDTYLFEDNENTFEKYNYMKYVSLEITMFDGTKVTKNDKGEYIYKEKKLPVVFADDQTKDNHWGLGVHNVDAVLLNSSVSFNVKVVDTPAKSVKINGVKLVKNTNKNDSGLYSYLPSYTITMHDGSKLNSDDMGAVNYEGTWHYLTITDDQAENAWDIGKHTVTGTVMGVSAEFEVEIIACPVKSVKAEKLNLIENALGEWEEYYDPDTDDYVGDYYKYDSYPYSYSVTLNNGTVLKSDETGYVSYEGVNYGVTDIVDNQDYYSQWTAGSAYNCTASVLGYNFSYEAAITGTPVKSVEIGDLTLIDGNDNEISYDENNRAWKEYVYDIYTNVKVTLKNGTVIKGEYGEVTYNGETFSVKDINDGQSYDNQWQPGNTYTITAKIMGFEASVKVHVVSNPISSVKVNADVVAIADDDEFGYYDDVYDDGMYVGTFFRYEYVDPLKYTVYYKNGTTVKNDEDGYIKYAGREFRVTFDSEASGQDYYNQWTAGNTYNAVGKIMGVPVNYRVKVLSRDALPSMTLKVAKNKIYVGTSTTVTAIMKNPDGATKFTLSGSKYASMTVKGSRATIRAKKPGKVTVKAYNNGITKSVSITIIKKTNPAKIKLSKKRVKYSALSKKAQTVKAITVRSPQGKVTFKKVKGDKRITVNKKTGKITLKKGMKKKTYSIKIKVNVAGNQKFNSLQKTVTAKVTVN